MKKYILIMLAGLSVLFSACTKENLEKTDITDSTSTSVDEAQSSFAKILSEAVSDNSALRSFIKETALQEFDCDYDVFYPYVKDEVVESGKTFRDILLEHCTETELSFIEQNLPKLNILVPDWSWLGCFSVNDWDATDSRVAVSYVSEEDNIEVFENGESLGNLPSGTIPGFPMLIVKSNERMSYTPSTKGSGGEYNFIDSAFENTRTKVPHAYLDITIDGTPNISNFVSKYDIDAKVKKAFEYFQGSFAKYQRDYLYYNMTCSNEKKSRRDGIHESLYKFKFKQFNTRALFDDKYDKEYELHKSNTQSVLNYEQNGAWATTDQLRSQFYAEGGLEMIFNFTIPGKSGSSSTEKIVGIDFADVFAIDHADLDFRHKTWFCQDWFVYTVDPSSIKPKWCIVNLELPDEWDVSEQSGTITVKVMEFDETGSSQIEYSVKYTASTNFKYDISGSEEAAKIGLGLSYTYTDETYYKETYTMNQGGLDNLGQAELQYVQPILKKKAMSNGTSGTSGYEVNVITTGSVDMMFIPVTY